MMYNFVPTTDRLMDFADTGRLSRILQADPKLANEPILDGSGLLPPLHVAALKGYAEAIDLLLDHEADIDAVDGRGRTILHSLATQKLWHSDQSCDEMANGSRRVYQHHGGHGHARCRSHPPADPGRAVADDC